MNVMATAKSWCFLAAIPLQPMAIPSISTMVPPIRALRWRTAVFAVFWPGWTRTAIRNKLTIEGNGKVSPRFGSHEYFGANLYSVPNGAALLFVLWHVIGMRMRDLTLRQLTAVPCPTCGVAPGKRCLLHSGAPRSEPHVDRKLSAAEAIETRRIPRDPGRR